MALVEPRRAGRSNVVVAVDLQELAAVGGGACGTWAPNRRTVVGGLPKDQKLSLQANSKTNEGGDHPDRDAQFSHIAMVAGRRLQRYPDAKRLTITRDGGGSNGSRERLWKRELQTLARPKLKPQ
jgi:Rhodopirellula transposase DDE domain